MVVTGVVLAGVFVTGTTVAGTAVAWTGEILLLFLDGMVSSGLVVSKTISVLVGVDATRDKTANGSLANVLSSSSLESK